MADTSSWDKEKKRAFNECVRGAKAASDEGNLQGELRCWEAALKIAPEHDVIPKKISKLKAKLGARTSHVVEGNDTFSTAVLGAPPARSHNTISRDDVQCQSVLPSYKPLDLTFDADQDDDAPINRRYVAPAAANNSRSAASILVEHPVDLAQVARQPPNNSATANDDDEDDCMDIGALRAKANIAVKSGPTPAAAYAAPEPASAAVAVVAPIDGYTISSNGKWASLPGGFRLPYKLFDQLYSYQRQGVAWMWSLHGAAPMPAGSLGRNSDDAVASAAGPELLQAGMSLPGTGGDGGQKLSGGILADDMGLGKTVQLTAFISGLFNSEKAECVLIVLPVSLIAVWQDHFARFAPNIRVATIHEVPTVKARERIVKQCVRDGGVVLTSYGMVASKPHVFGAEVDVVGGDDNGAVDGDADEAADQARDANVDVHEEGEEDIGEGFVRRRNGNAPASATTKPGVTKAKKKQPSSSSASRIDVVWDLMVLDEGHKVKNPSTQQAKAVRAVPSRYRLLLSGTPLQNNMDELWSLFDFTHCGKLLDTRRRFNREIGDRIVRSRDKKATAGERRDGALATEELMSIVGPYILRREKEKLLSQEGPASSGSAATTASGEEGEGGDQGAAASSSSSSTAAAAVDGLTSSLGLLTLTAAAPSTGARSTGMGVMGLKKEIVLWAGLSQPQQALYTGFLTSDVVKAALAKEGAGILAAIGILKKIACHPVLLGKKTREMALAAAGEEVGARKPAAEDSDDGDNDAINASSINAEALDGVVADEKEGGESGDHWDPTTLPSPSHLVAESAKLRLFVLLLRQCAKEGRKTLVFSQSTRMLDVLQLCCKNLYTLDIDQLDLTGWDNNRPAPAFATSVNGGTPEQPIGLRCRRIDGSMKQDERAQAVSKFNTDPSVAVAFLTTGVGSLGLTMTAATSVIIFDISWNPAVDAQAVDRAYRVGQTRDVVTYRIITSGTVEEKMYRQQVFKNGLTASVMGAQSKANTNRTALRFLTASDLRDLFTLGPTTYSITKKMVDDVISPPPVKSSEVKRHLDALACPPVATACVGLSHHDHLFKLRAEDAVELQKQFSAEARRSKKRKEEEAMTGAVPEGYNAFGLTGASGSGASAAAEAAPSSSAAGSASFIASGTASSTSTGVSTAHAGMGHLSMPLVHPGAATVQVKYRIPGTPATGRKGDAPARRLSTRLGNDNDDDVVVLDQSYVGPAAPTAGNARQQQAAMHVDFSGDDMGNTGEAAAPSSALRGPEHEEQQVAHDNFDAEDAAGVTFTSLAAPEGNDGGAEADEASPASPVAAASAGTGNVSGRPSMPALVSDWSPIPLASPAPAFTGRRSMGQQRLSMTGTVAAGGGASSAARSVTGRASLGDRRCVGSRASTGGRVSMSPADYLVTVVPRLSMAMAAAAAEEEEADVDGGEQNAAGVAGHNDQLSGATDDDDDDGGEGRLNHFGDDDAEHQASGRPSLRRKTVVRRSLGLAFALDADQHVDVNGDDEAGGEREAQDEEEADADGDDAIDTDAAAIDAEVDEAYTAPHRQQEQEPSFEQVDLEATVVAGTSPSQAAAAALSTVSRRSSTGTVISNGRLSYVASPQPSASLESTMLASPSSGLQQHQAENEDQVHGDDMADREASFTGAGSAAEDEGLDSDASDVHRAPTPSVELTRRLSTGIAMVTTPRSQATPSSTAAAALSSASAVNTSASNTAPRPPSALPRARVSIGQSYTAGLSAGVGPSPSRSMIAASPSTTRPSLGGGGGRVASTPKQQQRAYPLPMTAAVPSQGRVSLSPGHKVAAVQVLKAALSEVKAGAANAMPIMPPAAPAGKPLQAPSRSAASDVDPAILTSLKAMHAAAQLGIFKPGGVTVKKLDA